MPDRVSLLTPTCDRPAALALAERWIAAQTRQPDEWIVADGGRTPALLTRGQVHVRVPGERGAPNFTANLLAGLAAVTGDVLIVVEDDDYYAPTHIARILAQLDAPGIGLAGDDRQRYYNVAHRRWRIFQNRGASLCQTAIRRAWFPYLQRAIVQARRNGPGYGVDGILWQAAPTAAQSLQRTDTVVGIKGLPGSAGLGIGHRPHGPGWADDQSGQTLRAWIGDAADVYLGVPCP